MTAFLTGSRVYGFPREDSDVDLVILVDDDDAARVWKLGAVVDGEKTCRFGSLNLLVFQSRERFELWRTITEDLKKRAPVTRDDAVAAFQAAGFVQYGSKEEIRAELDALDAALAASVEDLGPEEKAA